MVNLGQLSAYVRYPRHLPTECEICVEAKLPTRHRSSASDCGQLLSSFSSSSFSHGQSSFSHGQSSSSLTASSSVRVLPLPISSQQLARAGKPHQGPTGKPPQGVRLRVEGGMEWDSGLLRPGVRGSALMRNASGIDSGIRKQKERD